MSSQRGSRTGCHAPTLGLAWLAGLAGPAHAALARARACRCPRCARLARGSLVDAFGADPDDIHVPPALLVRWVREPFSLEEPVRRVVSVHLDRCTACEHEVGTLRSLAQERHGLALATARVNAPTRPQRAFDLALVPPPRRQRAARARWRGTPQWLPWSWAALSTAAALALATKLPITTPNALVAWTAGSPAGDGVTLRLPAADRQRDGAFAARPRAEMADAAFEPSDVSNELWLAAPRLKLPEEQQRGAAVVEILEPSGRSLATYDVPVEVFRSGAPLVLSLPAAPSGQRDLFLVIRMPGSAATAGTTLSYPISRSL